MKLGIIGLGKLGEYYLRDFKKFKINSIVLKNSNYNSSIRKSKLLNKKYNIKIKAAKNYKKFFNNHFETTLICSPSSFHLNHLKRALKNNRDIIIEKPIIKLKKNKSKKWALQNLAKIFDYNKKIYYNLINEYYAEKYIKLFRNFKFCYKKFDFIFHTNGTHNFEEIVDDLLPHLFSILDKVHKYKKIHKIKKIIKKKRCKLQFYADNCFCNIEFLQGVKKKKLKFGIDKYLVERQIFEKNETLSIFLNCKKTNEKIKVSNPLTENIKRIVHNQQSYNKRDEYNKILNNLTKCCEIFYAK